MKTLKSILAALAMTAAMTAGAQTLKMEPQVVEVTTSEITAVVSMVVVKQQKSISNLGGTMRLGAYECVFDAESTPAKAYGSTRISERHRHRFEFNSDFREEFEKAGMKCVGTNPDTNLVEVVEIPTLRWFVGTQYHPEYNSTVLRPNPLFVDFIRAAINK